MKVVASRGEGLRFDLRSADHALVSDQRPGSGGGGAGPMPSELFLWAVGACFGQAVAHVATRMRVPLPGLRVEVDGTKDLSAFRFSTVVVAVEARCEAGTLERIAELAKKLCFVTRSISTSVDVRFELRATP